MGNKLSNRTINKIRGKISEYYQQNYVPTPPRIEEREFGAGNKGKIDFRHVSFENPKEFKKYLVSERPRFISYSAAYYKYPKARPMKKKEYKEADLIFDFDAECEHDTATCYQCLEKTRQETQKLIETFLTNDFGFEEKDIHVYFSGSKGYHVHIRTPEAKKLTGDDRKEIINYIQAEDLITPEFKRNGPKPTEKGWRGKIAKEILNFVKEADREKMEEMEISPNKIRNLIKRRDEIIEGIERGNYDMLPGPETLWKKVLNEKIVNLTSPIDTSVTMDTSRLIRVPGTIHGGSGLLCKPVKDIRNFNPFTDAVVFKEKEQEIKTTRRVPAVHLKGNKFGPYEPLEELEIPEYAAMLLVCKGYANPKW